MAITITQSPTNPLRFVIKVHVDRLDYENYLGRTGVGDLGHVDDPWLSEDQWSMGKYLRALVDHPAIAWLHESKIPYQIIRGRIVAEYPLVLQLFEPNEAMRFKLQL